MANGKASQESIDKDLLREFINANLHNDHSNVNASGDNPSPKTIKNKFSLVFVAPHKKLGTVEMISQYRRKLASYAVSASQKLMMGGYLVIGVNDVRIEEEEGTKRLWPLTMCACEDFENLKNYGLTLKEIVGVVPTGYSKNRHLDTEVPTDYIADLKPHQIPHLPIVHSLYFVYKKK